MFLPNFSPNTHLFTPFSNFFLTNFSNFNSRTTTRSSFPCFLTAGEVVAAAAAAAATAAAAAAADS